MNNILITGATGEIGSALAKFFSTKPINLTLAAPHIKKLQKLNADCSQTAKISLVPLNYNQSDSYAGINHFNKKLDGLVLILPKILPAKTCFPSQSQWMESFKNIFIDPLMFLKSLIPLLLEAKSSKIVLISGISSKIFIPNYAINGAIRAAWVAQVKAIASEFGQQGVRINTLSLGGVMTKSFKEKIISEAITTDSSFDDIMATKTNNVPLNKYASLDNVCHAVEGLLSNFTDHMTGSNFFCDGGFLRTY